MSKKQKVRGNEGQIQSLNKSKPPVRERVKGKFFVQLGKNKNYIEFRNIMSSKVLKH